MKKWHALVAVAGAVGLAGYIFRDRLLAAMLGLATRLQGLGEDWTEEDEDTPENPRTISFPKQEENLDAR